MKHEQSNTYFSQAKQVIPGGVNSPVRAFTSVGCNPIFIEKSAGSRIYDADNQSYIDYVGSWGPMILGHCHPKVVEAIQSAASNGASFGAPTYKEIELANMVCEAYPNIEKVRMVSSGTEATMSAIRLARGCTGRDKILKFNGCYHGHADSLLVKAGSGAATFGVPTSPGIPADVAKDTLTATYNDLADVKSIVALNKNEIACIILEPIAGNMGCVPPVEGFLQGLRDLCTAEGIVLIVDEVMTGFRVAYGGAQERFNVRGDLVCLGKIIGGGLPVGAFGGKKELMDQLSPEGGVYQAGTLSGNPLAMSAGIATLKLLKEEGFYQQIEEKSAFLEAGLRQAATAAGVTTCLQRVGGMFCTYFCAGPVNNFDDALTSDTEAFGRYFRSMLDSGVNLAPSQFEAGFMSIAHSQEDLEQTIEAAAKALTAL
ncbi:MAG: glutamate-1-semialdehyde-2,1-aminomutase [Desulfuromonadales bacterium C00003068]|jgi:glutamate-1-semialdehyde 2,1-aminomutase|nr:MAG: glutamate-1-semialdehyde-2,1-aminomutase [Desulfuromonadales bacterium C00003068]